MAGAVTKELRAQYDLLFSQAAIRPEWLAAIKAVARRALSPAHRTAYMTVEQATGVPWFVVAAIHNLESSQSMTRHLHNGDPLTARTVHVPEGRPTAGSPPFDWFASAIDALTGEGLAAWTDWSVAGIGCVLEGYNGLGYRRHHPQVKTPYLWSGTTIYTRGKYAADGVFDPDLVSAQVGAFALLIHLAEVGEIALPGFGAPKPDEAVKPTPALAEDDAAPLGQTAPPPYPGRYLAPESNGPEVELVQRRLAALGCDPKGFDQDLGPATESAVKMFQARSVGRGGEPLEIDGVVGPETWAALFGGPAAPASSAFVPAATSALGRRAIEIAEGEIGVREAPLGSNRGPKVDLYMTATSPGSLGLPWCMAFVYWCFKEAASDLGRGAPVPKTAGVLRGWDLAQSVPGATVVTAAAARRNPSLVAPGMIFYMDFGGGAGHTGIVVDNANGRLTTIEGNSNAEGGREGIGVFLRRSRKVEQVQKGFVGFA